MGKTDRRIEVPITNEKERQTYYEVINYRIGKVIVKDYPQGNGENTIKFVEYLIKENRAAQIVIIWDVAKEHYSQEFREYLKKINPGRIEEKWLVKCIRLAPNTQSPNPIEDVW